MKELGWQQESLTNSSSRPPIQIRSTRSDHMIKELSEVCEGEIPEHRSCLNLVGLSLSKV